MQTAQAYTLPEGMENPVLETGHITRRCNDHLVITCRDSVWQAMTAASCLIRPMEGDEVLFTPLPDGRAFVLAVLVRVREEAILDFPDGASLRSPLPIKLDSATAVSVTSPGTSVETANLDVRAADASVTVSACTVMTRLLRTAGERLEQSFDKLLGRYGNSHRLVREDDEVQARNVRVCAEESSLTQAGNVTQLARDLARIDAPQVHIS